jgi:hypothetical protein
MPQFDVGAGTEVTAADVMRADVGIRGREQRRDRRTPRSQAASRSTQPPVMPGGVDSHSHIEHLAATDLMNADTFERPSNCRRSLRQGHSSIMVFMTYDRLRIDDEKLLNVWRRTGQWRSGHDPRR